MASRLLLISLLAACNCSDPNPTRDVGTNDMETEDVGARDVPAETVVLPDVPIRDVPMTECADLVATIRDFRADHPDFYAFSGDSAYTGIVEEMLGDDGKPVYAHDGATPQTTGPENFAQWYNDVPGINESFTVELPLESDGAGLFVFDDSSFFPLDADQGFGDEGETDTDGVPRNFLFTSEVHTQFVYEGGEVFTFRGDDDLWLFINGVLAIDLGGLHPPQMSTVDLDAEAARLGIEVGSMYRMDIFHAERRPAGSNFRIETSIECFLDLI